MFYHIPIKLSNHSNLGYNGCHVGLCKTSRILNSSSLKKTLTEVSENLIPFIPCSHCPVQAASKTDQLSASHLHLMPQSHVLIMTSKYSLYAKPVSL